MQRWKYAYASVQGTSHGRSGAPCQDAAACAIVEHARDFDVLLVAACDGAGSAKLSHIGATETAAFIVKRMADVLLAGSAVDDLTRDVATGIVREAQERLRGRALEHDVALRELACTLVAGAVAADTAVFFQIGDGVAIISLRCEPGDEFSCVFWPERGEYPNTTTFLSDERVAEHLQHAVVSSPIDELAILTDGIQHLVLDYQLCTAHAPFFRRVMGPLRAHCDPGHSASLSAALVNYLDTTAINERTDDDKTLFLASRRAVEAP